MFKTTSILALMCSFSYMTSTRCFASDERDSTQPHEIKQQLPRSVTFLNEDSTDERQGFLKGWLSSDPIVISPNAPSPELERHKKTPQMPRSSSPANHSGGRFLSKDRNLALNIETLRSEEIRKIHQKETKEETNNNEGRVCSVNGSYSIGGTSPREKPRKSHSPKSAASSSPRFMVDDSTRKRKVSDGKKTETEQELVIPIKIDLPLKRSTHLPQIVLKMPEISSPISIVLSFDIQANEGQADLSPKKIPESKKRVRSAKSSPRTFAKEEELFHFDEKSNKESEIGTQFLSTSVWHSGQTVSLWDNEMLSDIILHTKKHHLLFSEEALKSTSLCIEKLNYFIRLQMLLRADNQYLSDALSYLLEDYNVLSKISDSVFEERQKIDLLMGVSNCHNNVCVSANKEKNSRYKDQHDAIDVILCEYVELYDNTNQNFSKTELLNPKLIRENAQLISSIHDFFKDHVVVLKNIEKERSDFLHFLDTFFGNVKREIKIEEALDGFPSLIDRHEQAARHREKITLSNLVLDAGELKATLSEKVSLMKKSDTPPSHHNSSSEEERKQKKSITPPRSDNDVSSQKK